MTEWGVFGVIVALASFIAAVVTPMLKLNSSITKLNVTINYTNQQLTNQNAEIDRIRERSRESHRKLWEKNDEQDSVLDFHDKRISKLENSR